MKTRKKFLVLLLAALVAITYMPFMSFASQTEDELYSQYLSQAVCFTAIEDSTISFEKGVDTSPNASFAVSIDSEKTWNPYTEGTTLELKSGESVYFKAKDTNGALSDGGIGWEFFTTGKFNLSGNILSLLYSEGYDTDDIINATLPEFAFRTLFSYANVVDASNLILPSPVLSGNCYAFMFEHCGLLENAPKLPAINLATECYAFMFAYCSNLKHAPELKATELADSCYFWMFAECTSLMEAPELPATELTYNCYQSIFMGCSSIESVVLPATVLSENCYRYIFRNCTNLKNVTLCFEADAVKNRSIEYWFDRVSVENVTITAPASLFEMGLLPKGCKYVELSTVTTTEIESHSLTLGEQIGVNFIVNVPEGETAQKMTFKIKGDTSECGTKEAEGVPQGDGTYKYTCYVNALQMADTIVASYADGEVIEEYSVTKYINDYNNLYDSGQLSNDQESAKALIDSLESYGYYTQRFLAEIHSDQWTLGTDYTAMDTPQATNFDTAGIDNYAIVKSELNDKLDKVTIGLDLESKTTLNVYVYTKNGRGLGKNEVSVKDATTGEAVAYNAYVVTEGEKYKISISGIAAHQLGRKFLVTILDDTTVNVSALSYAYSKISKGESEEGNVNAYKAMAALYNYYKQSSRYINSPTETDEEE